MRKFGGISLAVTVLVFAGCRSLAVEESPAAQPPKPPARADTAPAREPHVISLLDGASFEPKPGWIKPEDISLDFSCVAEPGFAKFLVEDADRIMKWHKRLDRPVDPKEYPCLEFAYRASGLHNDDREYVLWLVDERPEHGQGFELVIPREMVADGKLHSIRIPLARFRAERPITRFAIRVRSGGEGSATLQIEKLAFTRAPQVTAPLSLLDGRAFVAAPQWVHESRRSAEYRHSVEPGFAQFVVEDPGRNMKWGVSPDEPIDPKEWPQLVFQYRAQRMYDDGSEYVLWVSDDAREDHSGGYEAILPREIVSDGQPHTVCVNLARFNPPGRVRGLLIRVHSTEEGKAVLQIEKLEFTRAPQVTAPLSLLDGRAFEAVPEWVRDKSARSLDYEAKVEPGFASYAINDANREMKWLRRLETVADPKDYRWLEFRYRARGFRRRDDGGCVIWLADSRSTNWGGFEAVMGREIIADGEPHTIMVPMARFNPAGPVEKALVRVASGKEGRAVLEIEKLEFKIKFKFVTDTNF